MTSFIVIGSCLNMWFLCMHIQADRVSLLAVSGIDPFLPALGDGFLQGDR